MTVNRLRRWSAAATCLAAWSVLGLYPAPVEARVARLVFDRRESHSYGGKSFGTAGPYERITGRVFGELDLRDAHNAVITDLDLAPRNARGLVEYVATFSLWRPMGFPRIPGAPLPDHMLNPLLDYDFGADFRANDMSGWISTQPPVIRQVLPSLVPRVDADGNEVGGVPSVLHQVPMGTYLGWNVTRGRFSGGHNAGFAGGFIPFARTRAERTEAGDPRPSLEERYHDHAGYVAAVKAAAERPVERRFLLPDDAARLVREAEASDVLRGGGNE